VIPLALQESDYLPINPERIRYWSSQLPKEFILFVGVLRYYKGVNYLIEAMKNTNIPLVIVGDGPMKNEWQELAIKNNLHHIIFTGRLTDQDRNALYYLSSLVVSPACHRSEAFCFSLLEGLLFGKPLISTNLGTGTSFVNQHEKTGLVVTPRNADELRNAMHYLWEKPVLREEMGLAARQRFVELFSAAKMGETYLKEYEALFRGDLVQL
jgi:rhamnosyl/mannosyltransferase